MADIGAVWHRQGCADSLAIAIEEQIDGNSRLVRACLGCDRQYLRREVGWDTGRWGPGYRTREPMRRQPPCPGCGGRLISSVVNFGDPLPERELTLAGRHAATRDVRS